MDSIDIYTEENPGYYELQHNNPWFEERYSDISDERKQARLKCLQNPSQNNRIK